MKGGIPMKKRSKFDAKQYIDNNYVENEDAIISVYIKEMDDYYDEYDADDITISDDIISFIDGRVANISNKYNIILEFDTPVLTEDEKHKITSIIRSHYGLQASSRQQLLNTNKMKAFLFFLIGIIFLLLSSSLNYGDLIREILLIIGWVSIWETASVLLMDMVKIKGSTKNIDRLYNAEIRFIERK